MDELELRIGAIETALIEIFARLSPEALDSIARSLRADLDAAGDDERTQRLGALQLLEDGRRRFDPPALGAAIARPPRAP